MLTQLPLQSVSPGVQTALVHWPFTQLPSVQKMPQPPQFAGSLFRLEQSWKPKSLQRTCGGTQAQVKFWQSSPVEQVLPQPPQLFGSSCMSAHVGPQIWEGGAQEPLHLPALQNSLPGQTSLQTPQLAGSLCRLVQLPLQLVWPARQPHWKLLQTPLWQKLPQLPQL